MDNKQAHSLNIHKKLGESDPRIILTLLGISDLDLATIFAKEFEQDLTIPNKVTFTNPKERELTTKAIIARFSKIANLFTSLRGILTERSSRELFEDFREGKPQKIKNQEIYTKEIIKNKTKILDYVSKSLGRCQYLLEFFSSVDPKDAPINEVISNLENWIQIFEEFAKTLNKNSPEDYVIFLKNTEVKREAIKKIVGRKLDKTKGKFFKKELDEVMGYLSPDFGKEISQKLIDEFIETSLTLNTIRILDRLANDVSSSNPQARNEYRKEINILLIKSLIRRLYDSADKIKSNKNLSQKEIENQLRQIDENFLKTLVPIGNKLAEIFPHEKESSGSSLVEILADDNAICSGKTQLFRLVSDYLGIRDSQYAICSDASPNINERHTFNLFRTPSGRTALVDLNSAVIKESRGNIFSIRLLEEFLDPDQFNENFDSLVLDEEKETYRYLRFADNDSCYTYHFHKDFQICKSRNVLATTAIQNFVIHGTIEKFSKYLKSKSPSINYMTPELTYYLYTRYNLEILHKRSSITEDTFNSLLKGREGIRHGISTLTAMVTLESLYLYKNPDTLRLIFGYLENLKKNNSLVFFLNKYNEKEKYEYLKQKLGKF